MAESENSGLGGQNWVNSGFGSDPGGDGSGAMSGLDDVSSKLGTSSIQLTRHSMDRECEEGDEKSLALGSTRPGR